MKETLDGLFKPIRSSYGFGEKKKSTLVANQILLALKENELKPNERLPSERDISKQMQVSRTVVREALNALKIAGVVKIQIGAGTYVSTNPPQYNSNNGAVSLLEENESPFELWEARRHFEKVIGESAIERTGVDDFRNLKTHLNDMTKRVTASDMEGYVAAHRQFHSVLIDLAGNSILSRFCKALLDMSGQILTSEPTQNFMAHYIQRSLASHKEILSAIGNRDKEGYRAAIDRHYGGIIGFYLDEYET